VLQPLSVPQIHRCLQRSLQLVLGAEQGALKSGALQGQASSSSGAPRRFRAATPQSSARRAAARIGFGTRRAPTRAACCVWRRTLICCRC
jgi:hypothetical protein